MIIDCIADLHGYYPELAGGDLLIVAGDLTSHDTEAQHDEFWRWCCYQDYKKWVVIGGNHDRFLQKNPSFMEDCGEDFHYLCDSGIEFEGFKIWGSPWTLKFKGINPLCTAFTGTEKKLEEKFKLIPEDTDILITHGPPFKILDEVERLDFDLNSRIENTGSESLLINIGRVGPLLHVYGHIHERYGQYRSYLPFPDSTKYPIFVNCSHVNERYKPVNKPIRIEL